MFEAIEGIAGSDLFENGLHCLPELVFGSAGQAAQQLFDFGEDHFDRIQVRAVGRQIAHFRSDGTDQLAGGGALVAGEIVEDDQISRPQPRDQYLGDERFEHVRVHGAVHDGWREGAGHDFFGPNNAIDVWSVKKVTPQSMVHLTEKLVELAARAILYSSRPGENVLDLFGGNGSTLIAAEQTKRRAFLMELDPLYCDVIVKRWETFTGKVAQQFDITAVPGRLSA